MSLPCVNPLICFEGVVDPRVNRNRRHKLVDIYYSGFTCGFSCFGNNKFPGNKSSACKPGEEFENRMNPTKPSPGEA